MKRYVLLLGVLLCCILLKAQSATYTCRYWFDQNHTQAVTTYFSESTWQAELDVGSLSDGLHSLFLQVCDTSLVWETPKSYLFYKALDNQTNLTYHYWFDNDITNLQSGDLGNGNLLLDVDGLAEGMHMLHIILKGEVFSASQNYLFYKVATQQETSGIVYYCWFDQDMTGVQSNMLGNGNILLDVAELENGMHTVNVALQRNQSLCSTASYMFLKVETIQSDTLDMSHLVYHCWFDQDFDHQQTDTLGDGHFLLDVSELTDGLHTVNVLLEGDALTTTTRYVFMKVPVGNPSTEYQYHCWFDNDLSTMQTGLLGSGCFQLNVDSLTNGFHTVIVQLDDNGKLSVPQHYMFFIRPFGGYITKWEYWLNGDTDNRHTTDLSPYVDTLDIITLLPLETWPIRSTCFHFQPNGDEPYIIAKNEITLRFWDVDKHFFDKSSFYIDENIVEPIVADTLERNTTVSINAPRNNQIHWFKLDANRGEYLSFQADKACTMQLFAPSGEEVYAASGPESIVLGGFNVWEDGTYYLAVHDVMGSGETVSVTYNWIYRYSILSYDVHLVGNGGCSTITFQGNGFNSLLDAYLVNYQNDTIRQLDIGHESNTTTTISFNFYEENLGVYDAVFEFFEETIRINGALEVQEPVDIVLTSSVSYPWAFVMNTPCTYTYTITNNGNMSAYAVPLFVYVSTQTKGGISHLKFDGMNLASIISEVDLDSLSAYDIARLQVWAEEIGEDHHFFKFQAIDEETGDSVFVRSNIFYINLAPFETKTLTLSIVSNESVNVWITIPNEDILPLTLLSNRDFTDWYCCWKDKIACIINIIDGGLDLVSLFGGPALNLASCISSFLSVVNTGLSAYLCDGNHNTNFWDVLHGLINVKSLASMAVSCAKKFIPGANMDMLEVFDKLWCFMTLETLPVPITDCAIAFKTKNPECYSGNPQGGKSLAGVWIAMDPNDIHGYLSESGSHYIRQEIQNMWYEIEFENDSTLATAAARTIIVRDTLDATKFDLNSLAARSVTIGDKRLDLNGEQTFARTLDLRPEIYVIAQVEQDYDPATGIIQWTIQSLDPMTMEPTDDPNQGVLPVNYNGNGVGFIDYSIDLKEAFADGTEISNRVGIIFDLEEPVITDTWTNTVDAVKPISHIEEVTPVADSLSFSFVSEDNRSGVWYHSLYYRNDSTDMQWQVKKPQITENSLMLFFDDFQTTEYLVMAVDSAGNIEEKEMVAEYTYYYEGPGPASQTNLLTQGWNWWSTYVEMNNVDGLGMLQNSLGHNGLTIKSQNDFTDNYYQDMGEDYWYGSLESIHNEQGYLINVADACSVTMTGSAAIPALHPITIQPNWNWIGYPVAVPQTVANALSGFNPMPDDVVKGQSDFTSYYEGFGWYPDDFMLVPGQSYLYFSNANAGKTLTYASGSRGGALKSRKLGATYWNNNVHAYADNLSVMAVVKVDSVEQRDEHLELGAFVNGECRGSVRLRYFAPLDRYYAMLTVSGQEGDLVGFRLIHSESLEENETCGNHLVFSKNAIVGSLGKPYEIRFGEAEDAMVDMVLYPNPVERGASFSLMIPSGETVTEVIITDVVGNQLRHETGAIDAKFIKGLPTAGVYVIKAVSKSGNTYHGRLIVE